MTTTKITKQYNDNLLKRLVMSIRELPPLEFNPRSNPNLEIYQLKIK
jgi:hypothetical protein